MDISMRLYLVGIFGIIIGMIGALFVMVKMIDQSERYISEKSEHPPDRNLKNEDGGNSDGHSS